MQLRTTPNRSRLRIGFAFLLAATGLAVVCWYGEDWLALPHYSSAQIDRSAQLQLAVNIHQLPPNLRPDTPDERADMLQSIRQNEVSAIAQQRKQTETGLAAGLILLVLAAGQALASYLGRRQPDIH